MKPPIIGQKIDVAAIDSLIDTVERLADNDDALYVGYPVASTIEATITVPALLISQRLGLICFDVVPSARQVELDHLRERQRSIVLALKAKLLQHPDLADEDDLAFKINAVTFTSVSDGAPALTRARIVDAGTLPVALRTCAPFPHERLAALNAAIERVANIRPKSKRSIAKTPTSKGTVLKELESQIANLDSWQKAAAIETPDGPQRIRGLAGSGKTIVLALKAAYLHGEHADWRIGVTFHTRALKQQFNALIRRFYFEDHRQEPDDTTLLVMHSFGSLGESGVYSEICQAYGILPHDFGYAKRTYGYGGAFQGICAELLREVEKDPKPLFDALLIDEAQDLPSEFLRLAYHCTRHHRIIWAYDDLQNLGDYQMKSLRDTFGVDSDGQSLVALENRAKQPRQDIILPKCYRNTPWALVTAHALGSGIYRRSKLVQHPDDPELWREIGYELVRGELVLGEHVVLRRSTESYPDFFDRLLNPSDAVSFHSYSDDESQYSAVADMIKQNTTTDELYPHDIAVVFPDALSAEKRGMAFRQFLADRSVASHMVGVTSSRDAFLLEGKVAVSGPYRAKGNEAPMVYVMDADFCAAGVDLIKRRNALFTGITRSRGWVRVCGCGEGMDTLTTEYQKLCAKEFQLDFRIPTETELKRMRKLYRDVSTDDRRKVTALKKAFAQLPDNAEEAQRVLRGLPKSMREKLLRTLADLGE